MKALWAPWRMAYLDQPAAAGCFFCAAAASEDDGAHLVVARAPDAITLLNKYPYGYAHVLIAPKRHVGRLGDLDDAEYGELARAVRHAVGVLETTLRPEGINIGMNLGRAAGAGVADHCHWHALPRWNGDTNFMPLLAEVKVISEHLGTTWERLSIAFRAA